MAYDLNFPTMDYLDPLDKKFALSQLSTSNEIIGSNVAQARSRALGRLEQRGLGNSGIAAQSLADTDQMGEVARARAYGQYNDLLFKIREGNKNRAFQEHLLNEQRKAQQSQAFWNLAGDALSAGATFFGGPVAGGLTKAAIHKASDAGSGGVYESDPSQFFTPDWLK